MDTTLKRLDPWRVQLPKTDTMTVPAMIYTSEQLPLENTAVSQLYDAACLPPARKVLATPDIHQGFGVPIGCVMALNDAIMPAAVGYDINCGMTLMRTGMTIKEVDPATVAHSIARDVPLGEGKSNLKMEKKHLDAVLVEGLGAVKTLAEHTDHRAWSVFDEDQWRADMNRVERHGSLPGQLDHVPDMAREKGIYQLGTLGGGNHFLEIQQVEQIFDEDLARWFGLERNDVTVMIHSGSRRFGYEVADDYMKQAARILGVSGHQRELAYLTNDQKAFDHYIGAMNAAGNFAYVNRHIMALLVRKAFGHLYHTSLSIIYDVSHNMAQKENHDGADVWVHRKGATRAFGPARMKDSPFAGVGQPVIIPGSMGTGSYLLAGCDSSQEALCSVNHGAGRTMSRTAAAGKRSRRSGKAVRPAAISDEEFRRSMTGITLIAENKHAIKEEAPAAYKDIDAVIEVVCQAGLAKPIARLRPLAVLKG